MATIETVMSPCECGCGTPTARRFRPGHDAKLKGELIRTILRGERPEATEDEHTDSNHAANRIASLGWATHLELSRESLAKRKASRRKPEAKPEASVATPAPAPTEGDVRTAEGGTLPASATRKLAGVVGRKPKAAAVAS